MKTMLAIALLAASTGSAQRVERMPAAFVGTWEKSVADCASHSDMRLEITPTELSFHESSGPLKAVVANSDTDVAVIVELSGEGETWLDSHFFTVEGDVLHQTDGPYDPAVIVRHRCPANASAGK